MAPAMIKDVGSIYAQGLIFSETLHHREKAFHLQRVAAKSGVVKLKGVQGFHHEEHED